MYILNNRTNPNKLEEVSFKSLNMKESDIEEMLRKNIDMLCDDDYSMLVVGQQVCNVQNGRSDLTAIDSNGDMVLIEIKRDKQDILHRKEAFEFQAIRYAASCASIRSIDDLVQDVFAPYVEKNKSEYKDIGELTSSEYAKRLLNDFLKTNQISPESFNHSQRIMLVASEFDEQTLSAVAWLNKNNVDISCYEIRIYKHDDNVLIDLDKILPLLEWNDFFVDLKHGTAKNIVQTDISRRSLPKIDKMIEWGVVKAGDIITPINHDEEAVLLANGNVEYDGKQMSLQQWLKQIFGWPSVATYAFSVHKETGRTLSDLREEYMNKQIADNDDDGQE